MQTCYDPQNDILIVDDLADNLRVLSTTLSSQGFRVRAARNGAMALVGAKAAPPSLILLDIRMPEMDGYEVCRQLKADPQLCAIPVIFLSALDEAEDKAKAFEMGGVDYITKPFQAEEVITRVKNQFTIQQLRNQVTIQQKQLEQGYRPATTAPAAGLNVTQRDFLTAITTILDYSDRLSQTPGIDPEHYAGLQVIHQNGQNLLDLVNQQLERFTC